MNLQTYSSKQIAEILGISEYTVRHMLKNGKINGFKLTRQWRVSEAELNKFMKGKGGTTHAKKHPSK